MHAMCSPDRVGSSTPVSFPSHEVSPLPLSVSCTLGHTPCGVVKVSEATVLVHDQVLILVLIDAHLAGLYMLPSAL